VRIDLGRLGEYRERLTAYVTELRRRYRISRVILFGSFARPEDLHEMSDIDLVVVGDIPGRFTERIGAVREMTDLPVEPLVYTDEEWKEMLAGENSFIEEVVETGVDM